MTVRRQSNNGGNQPGAVPGVGRSRSSSLRVGLALTRALLLYGLFCWLIMGLGLELRDAREHGLGLAGPPWANLRAGSEERIVSEPAEPGDAAHGLPFVGVTVELEQMAPAQRSLALARLSDHGVGWVRQRFDWNVLEPTPGAFDWQQSDAMIASVVASGLTPIVLLDGSPAWARRPQDRSPADNPLAPPADPAAFADFAANFARRYGEDIRFYQIWNEPNIAPHWGNQHVEPTAYARLLIQVAQAIRAADPDAVIIAGALAPTADRGHTAVDEVYFLQRMYAAGVKPYVDMMAIQPFGFGRSAQNPTQQLKSLNFQRAALIRRAMVAAGDDKTPLLAARFGWNRQPASPWATVDATAQQAYLSDALTIGWRQWPWLAGMGWAIDQPNAPETDPLWGFALNDPLLETVDERTAVLLMPRSGYAARMPWWSLLATAMLATVLGRAQSALRLLPWVTWQTAYRNYRPAIKILLWLFLIALYYLATWPPLILFLLIMASILIAMQPYVGLWLAAAFLPFHFQHKELLLVDQTLWIPPAQAVILASLPAIAIRARHNQQGHRLSALPRVFQPLDWFGIGWLAIGLLTMVNVWHWPAYWTGMIDLMVTPLLLYWMVRLFATDQRTRTVAAIALLSGGVLVAALGLTDWLAGGGTEADALRRLTGPYFSPNHAALYLERSLFLGLGILLYWKTNRSEESEFRFRTTSILLLTAIVAIGVALLLTASRGAILLGLPVGLGIFIWLERTSRARSSSLVHQSTSTERRKSVGGCGSPPSPPTLGGTLGFSSAEACSASPRIGGRGADPRTIVLFPPCCTGRNNGWITAGLAATILLSLGLIGLLYWPRLGNMATISERLGVWQASWTMWRSMPMFGSGPGGFFWRYPTFLPAGSGFDPNLRHPHNIWLESLTIWGGIGTIWLIAGLGWAVRTVWHERRDLGAAPQRGIVIGLLAGLAAGMAHGQVDAFGALADLAAWNWIALGLWRSMMREQ